MRPIGFSTGALTHGAFRDGLSMVARAGLPTVELSALRDHELAPLMEALPKLDLERFRYVSIHVPSKFKTLSEAEVARLLQPCIERRIPLVLHPDAIGDDACWRGFGSLLCIENMDKRKPIGRTVEELDGFFARFPDASFCFDVAHAYQVDSTMTEARAMLRRYGKRLKQIHISEIDSEGKHYAMSIATILASQRIAALIPEDIAIVIESQVPEAAISIEVESAQRALDVRKSDAANATHADWGGLA